MGLRRGPPDGEAGRKRQKKEKGTVPGAVARQEAQGVIMLRWRGLRDRDTAKGRKMQLEGGLPQQWLMEPFDWLRAGRDENRGRLAAQWPEATFSMRRLPLPHGISDFRICDFRIPH